jgi:hypothetical protein
MSAIAGATRRRGGRDNRVPTVRSSVPRHSARHTAIQARYAASSRSSLASQRAHTGLPASLACSGLRQAAHSFSRGWTGRTGSFIARNSKPPVGARR